MQITNYIQYVSRLWPPALPPQPPTACMSRHVSAAALLHCKHRCARSWQGLQLLRLQRRPGIPQRAKQGRLKGKSPHRRHPLLPPVCLDILSSHEVPEAQLRARCTQAAGGRGREPRQEGGRQWREGRAMHASSGSGHDWQQWEEAPLRWVLCSAALRCISQCLTPPTPPTPQPHPILPPLSPASCVSA